MKRLGNKKSAFTLIELMTVITIMAIIMFATYIPYEHHQKKTLLRQAAREISQSLSEARNLAIHGLDTGSGNLTIALHVVPWENKIDYYAYPYLENPSLATLNVDYKFKTKDLPRNILIESVDSKTDPFLFSFFAISGSGSFSKTILPIVVSYAGSDEAILQKEIQYYTKSYISDYQ